MKAIILKNNEVLAIKVGKKKRVRRCYLLEYCKNNEVQDKLAYWRYTCLPEFRANLTEHQNLVKFAFFNPKLGTTLYSVHDSLDNLKQIKHIEDYEPTSQLAES